MLTSLVMAALLAPGVAGAKSAAKSASKASDTAFAVLYPFAGAQRQQVQPALEKLGAAIAQKGPWKTAQGRFFQRPSQLTSALSDATFDPAAILLPLSDYLQLRLALRGEQPRWKASHEVALVSPQQSQFFLVTDDPKRKDCRNASVATHHLDDTPFVNAVVAHGSDALSKVNWKKQRRPMQVLKTLVRGQADCALIDQAQLEAARQIEPSADLKVLWRSAKLPSMVVVLRKDASAWRKVLASLCSGASSSVCQEAGLVGFSKVKSSRMKAIERQYAQPPARATSPGAAASAPMP